MLMNPTITRLMLSSTGGLALMGLVFNLLLLRVLWRIGELWGTFTFRLIACAAVGDCIASLSIMGSGIFRLKLGYPGVFESPWYCRTFSFGLLFFHNLSGLAVCMISLDRYLVVQRQTRLPPLYTCIVLGTIALTYAIVLGLNGYQNKFRMDKTNSFCLPAGKPMSNLALLFATVLVNATLVILCFCYTAVFLICLRIHRGNKHLFGGRSPIRALIWLVAYLLCYLPKLIGTIWSLVIKSYPPLPIVVLMIVGLSATVIINPILVLFLNSRAHHEVMQIFAPNSQGIHDTL